jgi:diguanylate cyclase (GGDEF)-like protein/PAS domain S-box-containing protein
MDQAEAGDQDALRASEAHYRDLVENATDVVFTLDVDGALTWINQAGERLSGYTRAELCAMTMEQLLSPACLERARTMIARKREHNVATTYELEVITKDGRTVPLEVNSRLIHRDGTLIGTQGTARDITERKQMEEALRASEERFRLTFDQAAIGIAHVDPTGRWLRANQGICAMLGYTQEELCAGRFQEITHPDDLADNLVLFERLMAGELSSYVFEKRYICKDGSIVWGNATTSVVRDASGTPQYSISIIENITERKQLEQQLRHQALHDALTELPNRTLLQDRLEQAIRSAHRDQTSCALLLLDLDRFKEINDTFGHHFGDMLLRHLALRLQRNIRESDSVARLGGDEFAVLLPGVDGEGADEVARKLQSALAEPFELDGQQFHSGGSIGIAVYPDHGVDASTLLRHADIAMYVAKREREGFARFQPEHAARGASAYALVADLRAAIDQRNHLSLHYQPIVSLADGRVHRVEALARWNHPRLGLIPPDQFIELAEHADLIKPLTLWAINAALEQQAAWHWQGLDVPVAVNLSVSNLQDRELVAAIEHTLASWRADASLLGLEITESGLMSDPDLAMRTVSNLHNLHIRISIDDFGTGYSSLAYLKRLPVHEVKIDKSFVIGMRDDENDASIVRAVIQLGHQLGLDVVAEGVEDEGALARLRELGCDFAQGYHLSRPMSAAAATEWLRQRVQAAQGLDLAV